MIEHAKLPRWWRYVKKRRLTCPLKHHIPEDQNIPEHGFIRCDHWIAVERRECGTWVFLYAVRGGKAIVAEVQLNEMRAMEELATPAEMIDYLGILPE